MRVSSFYPVVAVDDVASAAQFFQRWFGFEPTFEADWYVSLRAAEGHELAVLQSTHPTVPEGFRDTVAGILLNFQVADVDAEWNRLVVDGGLLPLLDIRTEEFGQRHFIVAGPGHAMVDVITVIPPGAEYAANYVPTGER